jgi:PmbA protein
MMDILNSLRNQVEQVEVVRLKNLSTSIEFEANNFKTSKVAETSGVAIRVVKGGRQGFSASSDESAMDQLVVNVLDSAKYGDLVPLKFPGWQNASAVKTYDPVLAELPVHRLVDIGKEIVDYLLSFEPEARVNISLSQSIQQVSLQNQAGCDISFQRTPLSISVEAERIEGDDILIIFDVVGTTVWEEDYMAFARRLGEKFVLARRLTSIESAKLPVLFSPSGSLALLLPLMEGVDGKNVYTGISPIKDQRGEKIFDSKITFYDDGTLDGKFGSAPYDDEGVPHQRNALVDQGVLKGFLYDLKTAAQSGVESTGNGSRSLFNPPVPAPTNLVLAGGETPLADIISGIKEGLLVEDVLGMGQGNIISGAFSNPLSLAFKIHNGEIVGRVKDVSIAGNIYDLLKDVSALSRETLWQYQNFCLPYILLPEMNIVAKE